MLSNDKHSGVLRMYFEAPLFHPIFSSYMTQYKETFL